jgi:purine-nucleoside phosphorylase
MIRNWPVESIREAAPTLGIVLGSGLGSVADGLGIQAVISYADIPGLPASRVKGHAGRFVLSQVAGTSVLIAQGRSHLYEGHSAKDVTAHIRFMHEMGVKTVLLTNAAGAIRADLAVGDLMLITDHINLSGTTPLLGGAHFHDMTEVYCKQLRANLASQAVQHGIRLHQGVYASLLGPQYETPAEIRMLRAIGADAVGMSTVLEAIQARALDMKVVGISTLTNWAAGLSHSALDHQEVIEIGQKASGQLTTLIQGLAASLSS